jgi:hypothetical protein
MRRDEGTGRAALSLGKEDKGQTQARSLWATRWADPWGTFKQKVYYPRSVSPERKDSISAREAREEGRSGGAGTTE